MKKILSITIFSILTLVLFLGVEANADIKAITVKNDTVMTQKKCHPVMVISNNTKKDINITYDFYVDEDQSDHFAGEVKISAKKDIVLELPQLHHLGDSNTTRKIWFSWVETNVIRPTEIQIETSLFKNNTEKSMQNIDEK